MHQSSVSGKKAPYMTAGWVHM